MKKIINWTKEQEDYIKNNHCKITLTQIAKDLNMSYFVTRAKAQRMGLYRNRTNIPLANASPHNYNFFEELNLITCSISGRIASDGNIGKNKKDKGYVFKYSCSIKDECLIDDIIKQLKFKGPKVKYIPKDCFNSNSQMVRIQVGAFTKNAQFLEKHYNITPDKTFTLKGPNFNDKYLILSYIIGLIDGDGCIGFRNYKDYSIPYITMCGASVEIIKWYKDFMDNEFTVTMNTTGKMPEIDFQKRGISKYPCYRYTMSGTRAAIIIDYLRQFPIFKLPRKWDQPEALAYIENKKKQFPQLFKVLDMNEIQKYLPPPENLEKLEIPPETSIIN